MHIVQCAILDAVLDVSEALGLLVEILRLIKDAEAGFLHSDKVLPAELAVVTDSGDFEPALAHLDEPVDYVCMVDRRTVAHGQPSVILPSEQRNVIFVRLSVGDSHREKGVRDYDIHALVVADKGGGSEVMQL